MTTTKVFGCSIKWADKSAGVKEGDEEWAKENVEVKMISEQEIACIQCGDRKTGSVVKYISETINRVFVARNNCKTE